MKAKWKAPIETSRPAMRPMPETNASDSPVLRAVGSHFAGTDPGEPDYLHGYSVQARSDGAVALHSVDAETGGTSVSCPIASPPRR